MAPDTYAEILARNIRAARTRADVGQESLAARMRALGYGAWIRQTVGSTERGRRRPTAEEVFALSLALETSIASLMSPAEQDKVIDLPSGERISVAAVQMSAHGISETDVSWEGDIPVFSRGGPHSPPWQRNTSYIQAVQAARRRRAWEQLPEEEQARKLEATVAMESGASGDELADLGSPGVTLEPLTPREDMDVFKVPGDED